MKKQFFHFSCFLFCLCLAACGGSSSETVAGPIPPPVTPGGGTPPPAPPPIFPHTSDWKNPEVHGVYVQKSGLQVCRLCHGQNLEGQSGPACNTCHKVFPHTATWEKDHALQIRQAKSTAGCVTKCHGTDLKGGLSGVRCDKCHSAYPHETGWITKHGTTLWDTLKPMDIGSLNVTLGGTNSLSNCTTTCHNSADSFSKQCWSCHQTNRHLDGWKTASGHAASFTGQLPSTSNTNCMVCHGGDYSGDTSNTSCSQCHDKSHLSDWKDPSHHGVRYQALEVQNTVNCFSCHAAPVSFDKDYNGVPASTTATPVCYTCHKAYPHTAYRYTDGTSYPWKGNDGWAHVLLIMNNRQLLPGANLSDPVLVQSLKTNCAGPGGCHAGGKFSTPQHGGPQPACSTVCHLH